MSLLEQYRTVRKASEAICRPLQKEDYVVQPIVDVSPPKWHLGHTTWFWEAFVLIPHQADYHPCNPDYNFVFNSYYETIGARVVRTDRGNLSRPSVDEVYDYRRYVDAAMEKFISAGPEKELEDLIVLGLNHEQQHQELLYTDIKYILGHNPLLPAWSDHDIDEQEAVVIAPQPGAGVTAAAAMRQAVSGEPVYARSAMAAPVAGEPIYAQTVAAGSSAYAQSAATGGPSYAQSAIVAPAEIAPVGQASPFLSIPAGLYEIGYAGTGFCFDNELARHKVYLGDFRIAAEPVTNEEYIEFIEDGGYKNFTYWHAEGWDWVKKNSISAPLYWHLMEGRWHQYTLAGLRPLDSQQLLCHISYYEAVAFAAWKGYRLPTEFEWEVASGEFGWGKRWEWTESAYLPYPGFKKAEGAIGEYNGKFMVSQMVLRGASVATPAGHSRNTYRNFFHPYLRWQFTGMRLAI
jgi:formylglycine-generating enzyme required for sulfatase activity